MKNLKRSIFTGLLVLASTANASESITLKLDMFINGDLIKPVVLQGELSQSFSAQIDNEVKYEITPSIENGKVKLSTVYYTYTDGAFSEKARPVLTVNANEPATIEIGQEGLKIYKLQVTPETKI